MFLGRLLVLLAFVAGAVACASPDASIVCMASAVGRHARAYWGAYAVSKHALEGFAGHGEQANIRVRRFGGRDVPYAGAAEPVLAAE